MSHIQCNGGQYEEAVKEKSFKRLLPYPCKLVLWQLHHPQDSKRIGKISSHYHGLFHRIRCFTEGITIVHPLPHRQCGKDCRVIDKWMKKTLQHHLLFILYKRLQKLPQQTLLEQ